MSHATVRDEFSAEAWQAVTRTALRVAFGLIWVANAAFTWTSGFAVHYVGFLHNAAQGQPGWSSWWFDFWIALVSPHAALFVWLTRIIETALALALLLGIARRTAYAAGALFSLLVWSTAEGFGGPYTVGATNMGAGIVYVLVFIALLVVSRSGPGPYSLDHYIERAWPGWRRLSEWRVEVAPAAVHPVSWRVQGAALAGIALLVFFLVAGLYGSLHVKPPTPTAAAAAGGARFRRGRRYRRHRPHGRDRERRAIPGMDLRRQRARPDHPCTRGPDRQRDFHQPRHDAALDRLPRRDHAARPALRGGDARQVDPVFVRRARARRIRVPLRHAAGAAAYGQRHVRRVDRGPRHAAAARRRELCAGAGRVVHPAGVGNADGRRLREDDPGAAGRGGLQRRGLPVPRSSLAGHGRQARAHLPGGCRSEPVDFVPRDRRDLRQGLSRWRSLAHVERCVHLHRRTRRGSGVRPGHPRSRQIRLRRPRHGAHVRRRAGHSRRARSRYGGTGNTPGRRSAACLRRDDRHGQRGTAPCGTRPLPIRCHPWRFALRHRLRGVPSGDRHGIARRLPAAQGQPGGAESRPVETHRGRPARIARREHRGHRVSQRDAALRFHAKRRRHRRHHQRRTFLVGQPGQIDHGRSGESGAGKGNGKAVRMQKCARDARAGQWLPTTPKSPSCSTATRTYWKSRTPIRSGCAPIATRRACVRGCSKGTGWCARPPPRSVAWSFPAVRRPRTPAC